jgi:hypothetical protein
MSIAVAIPAINQKYFDDKILGIDSTPYTIPWNILRDNRIFAKSQKKSSLAP